MQMNSSSSSGGGSSVAFVSATACDCHSLLLPPFAHAYVQKVAASPGTLQLRCKQVSAPCQPCIVPLRRRYLMGGFVKKFARRLTNPCCFLLIVLPLTMLPWLLRCRYLMGEFVKNPIACLTLASYLITNTGEQISSIVIFWGVGMNRSMPHAGLLPHYQHGRAGFGLLL